MYLFGSFLNKGVLMRAKADDEPEKVVEVGEGEGVGDAFGFDDQ